MSDSTSRLPSRASFEQLQKQAKELLKEYRAGDQSAIERFHSVTPRTQPVTLADAQFVLAREYGFESWAKLRHHLEAAEVPGEDHYDRLAKAIAGACKGDVEELQHLHQLFGATFTCDEVREKVQQRLSAISGSANPAAELTLSDARLVLARQHGFESWAELVKSLEHVQAGSTPPFFRINWKDHSIEAGLVLSEKDWDAIFAAMKEQGITALNAGGRMTDAALARLCQLGHVRRLDLGGSLQLTDDGLAHLAELPHLEQLDLSGWKGSITDRGLEVLRHLPQLREFQMCWQQNVSDAGIAHLSSCEHLESVDLLGTPAGDGAIRALAGKPGLRSFKTGRGVTDAGLALLQEFPVFKKWRGGDITYGLMSPDAGPNHLLVDGPFTNVGLASLAGLDGLFGLTFFWHCPEFTSAGLQSLAVLPNLGFLGCQDEHCDDEAMRHIAAIPQLRMLMGQGAVASDAGFAALSRSKTIEHIWGRECPNLTGRGFAALAAMPALRGLAVSCKNVDDAALARLPDFPALRELMPMDVSDEGFLHVGRCEQLEALWCMYCRETGDIATEYIAGLSQLKSYYAGSSKITDRSLEILGRMASLERLEFWQCGGITNAGVAHLARLPRLREISLDGLAGVTRDAAALFPAGVRVNYSA